jgi:hypothetical protein
VFKKLLFALPLAALIGAATIAPSFAATGPTDQGESCVIRS